MLNKFLSGKKKYSVFIATFLVAVLQTFVGDPETQNELMDFVPTLAMMLSGVVYLIVEGIIDAQREKTNTAQAQAAVGIAKRGLAPPAQPQQEFTPIAASQPISTSNFNQSQALDIKLFHERVLNDTGAKYTELNPATVFSEAKDKGSVTTCHDIKQAQDYWDYLVTLAYGAEQYVRAQTLEVRPGEGPACKVQSPEYVYMQLEMSKTIRNRDNVYTLAGTSIDWRKKLFPNDTLYHIGVLAEELLKQC